MTADLKPLFDQNYLTNSPFKFAVFYKSNLLIQHTQRHPPLSAQLPFFPSSSIKILSYFDMHVYSIQIITLAQPYYKVLHYPSLITPKASLLHQQSSTLYISNLLIY